MHVESVCIFTEYFVVIDGVDYQRGMAGGWDQRMGERWEPVYRDEELEAAFQAYQAAQQRIAP